MIKLKSLVYLFVNMRSEQHYSKNFQLIKLEKVEPTKEIHINDFESGMFKKNVDKFLIDTVLVFAIQNESY